MDMKPKRGGLLSFLISWSWAFIHQGNINSTKFQLWRQIHYSASLHYSIILSKSWILISNPNLNSILRRHVMWYLPYRVRDLMWLCERRNKEHNLLGQSRVRASPHPHPRPSTSLLLIVAVAFNVSIPVILFFQPPPWARLNLPSFFTSPFLRSYRVLHHAANTNACFQVSAAGSYMQISNFFP